MQHLTIILAVKDFLNDAQSSSVNLFVGKIMMAIIIVHLSVKLQSNRHRVHILNKAKKIVVFKLLYLNGGSTSFFHWMTKCQPKTTTCIFAWEKMN